MARLTFLPSLLLSLLLLKPSYTNALTSAELPVPARTHTFNSYLQDPVFTALVPVFVATALRLQGSYCQDDVKALNGGGGLLLGPNADSLLGDSLYTIKSVYQSPRRENRYKSICTGSTNACFAFKQQAGKVRLMVNMQALNEYYLPLYGTMSQKTNSPPNNKKPRFAKKQFGYYYDPSGLDGVTPYFPGLTAGQIKRAQRRQAKQERRDRRETMKAERAWVRYDVWVAQQLALSIYNGGAADLQAEYDSYYTNVTNKQYPYKYASVEDSGVYVKSKPSSTSKAPKGRRGLLAGGEGVDGGDGEVEIENFSATSYIYDYAIIFAGPDGVLKRLDLTIVPRVFRKSTPHVAYLCKPDGSTDPVKLPSTLKDYIPRTDTCASYTTRSAPYALSSPKFKTLHPEEANWLFSRLDKTGPLVEAFVSSKLPNKTLTPQQARLKIGISNMGGGKRAMIYSLGVTKALFDLGVFEQSAWASGLSGSAWYVTAHYAAMKEKAAVVDPKVVFDDIKSSINNTVYDDTFEMNEVLTDNLQFMRPTFHWSRLGDKNKTNEIFCEGELKLQSPLTSSRRSASALEYYARSITSQSMPSNSPDIMGLGLTFSSLASSSPISTWSAPLPLYQNQENKGDGSNYSDFRLWEWSPFDVATNDGNLHVSFPTALLGSNAQSTTNCTVGLDNSGYLQGLSSYAFYNFFPQAKDICATKQDGQETICQAVPLQNPYKGFADISGLSPDLYSKPEVFMTDGGWNCGHPMWMYLSPTRQADIVFIVDSGGGSNATTPTFSTDTTPADTKTCPLDADSVKAGQCIPWLGTGCCYECFTGGFFSGCFSTNDVSKNYIFLTIEAYKAQMPVNTVPPYPKADGSNYNPNAPTSKFGQRVLFLGCHTVSDKTPLVIIPNRIVKSGQSGHSTEKGAINVNIPLLPRADTEYSFDEIVTIFQNSEAGLPSLPGVPDFPKCIACLYYAKALGQDNFMSIDSDCKPCFDSYCFVPTS